MPKKTEWEELRKGYITGEVDELAEYLRVKLGSEKSRWNGYLSRMTKGWKEERANVVRNSLERAKDKHVDQVSVPNEKLLKMKENILKIIGNKIATQKEDLNAKDLKDLIGVIKTELGEPTTIAKNTNENNDKVSLIMEPTQKEGER